MLSTVVVLAIASTPVGAETPSELAEELAVDGVYVAPSRDDVDEAALEAVVEDLRFESLRINVVAPVDPVPDTKAFARRIQEKMSSDAAIVFPPPQTDPEAEPAQLEAYAVDDLSDGLIRALSAARAEPDPAEAVRVFASELTVEPDAGRPAIIGRLILLGLLLAAVLGGVVVFERSNADGRRQRQVAPAEFPMSNERGRADSV